MFKPDSVLENKTFLFPMALLNLENMDSTILSPGMDKMVGYSGSLTLVLQPV